MWVDIYIYICCCLLSFLLLDPPPPLSPPPLSLPSLDTSLARPLSPFVCRPSEASTCMHACMHTAAYTFISDIFLLLLLMRTYLSSSVPPCQEKISTSSWGASIYFLHNFSLFWFEIMFTGQLKERALRSLTFTSLGSHYYYHYRIHYPNSCGPCMHLEQRERERELYYLLHSDPKEREST